MVLARADSINASQGKFVLVVDGNASGSSGLQAFLKQFRYKVLPVNTAAKALEVRNVVMPALVIVGHIDDMTQVDFIREFKRCGSSCTAAIIVVMCGKDAVHERACLAAGAVTCLKLPMNVETLYRTIQVAIESVPRMNLRIHARVPVIIDDKAVKCGEGNFAIELSESGLFLLTSNPCPLNTKISLKFKVSGRILSADTVVIYAHKPGNKRNCTPGMGLQFVRISDQDQEQIRLFIREEVRREISSAQRA
jgi:CheY-like chemotaxis protein